MRASRFKMLRALFSKPALAPTWRLFRWHISRDNPRFLRMTDGEIFEFLQKEGGPQGDPLMPLMFSLLMAFLLDRVLASRPALAAAYLDDTTIGGKVPVVRQIFVEMVRLAPVECGFEINLTKTVALSVHPNPSPGVLSFVREFNLDFHYGSTPLVGSIIGTDAPRMSAWLVDKVRKHETLFEVLSHSEMPPQIGHRLLRQVLLPKMTHLLRAHHPDLMHDAACMFDKAVLLTYAKLTASTDLYLADHALSLAQSQLKVSHLGAGLEPAESTCYLASYSALAAAVPDLIENVVPVLNYIDSTAAAVDAEEVRRIRRMSVQIPADPAGAVPAPDELPTDSSAPASRTRARVRRTISAPVLASSVPPFVLPPIIQARASFVASGLIKPGNAALGLDVLGIERAASRLAAPTLKRHNSAPPGPGGDAPPDPPPDPDPDGGGVGLGTGHRRSAPPAPPRIAGLPASLQGRWQSAHNFIFSFLSSPSSLDKKCLPDNYNLFLQHFSSSPLSADQLQFTLGHALHQKLAADLHAMAPRATDRIRLTALSMPNAHSFLNADLADARLRIAAPAYNFFLRLRDGRPIANILSYRPHARCACGSLLGDDPASHWLTCPKLRAKQWARHNRLVKAWHYLAELCGVFSIEESHLPNGSRSDNHLHLPQTGVSYHTDTSVVHPCCASYLNSKAQTQPGYAAAARVNQKTTKYQQIVERVGARFRALVFETFGGTSHHVEQTIDDFYEAATLTGQPHPPSKAFMRHYLQKALIEGNALVFADGLKFMPK